MVYILCISFIYFDMVQIVEILTQREMGTARSIRMYTETPKQKEKTGED